MVDGDHIEPVLGKTDSLDWPIGLGSLWLGSGNEAHVVLLREPSKLVEQFLGLLEVFHGVNLHKKGPNYRARKKVSRLIILVQDRDVLLKYASHSGVCCRSA